MSALPRRDYGRHVNEGFRRAVHLDAKKNAAPAWGGV